LGWELKVPFTLFWYTAEGTREYKVTKELTPKRLLLSLQGALHSL